MNNTAKVEEIQQKIGEITKENLNLKKENKYVNQQLEMAIKKNENYNKTQEL